MHPRRKPEGPTSGDGRTRTKTTYTEGRLLGSAWQYENVITEPER